MTLVEFLTARLDEDEAVARAPTPGPWQWGSRTEDLDHWGDGVTNLETVEPHSHEWPDSPRKTVITAHGYDAWGIEVEDADAAHSARYDPARVLADIAAKRAMLVERDRAAESKARHPEPLNIAIYCAWQMVVGHLARPYADHPDYNPQWSTP